MNSLSIKNKTLLLVFATMMVSSAILVGMIYLNQKHKLQHLQTQYYQNVKKSYEKILKKHDEFYYSRANANLQSTGVREALYAKDREKLYALTKGRWEALKKGNPYLVIMHFHLADGTSFLRMHEPQRYGDSIAAVRPMVAKIHREQKPLHGFETGIADLAYRTLVPIFYGGHYIGALEFGAKPNDIFEEMEYFNELHGALFVKSGFKDISGEDQVLSIGEYYLQSQTLKNRNLLKILKKQGYDFKNFDTRVIEGKTYNIYSFDMPDFEGSTTAKAVFFQNITGLEEDFHKTLQDLLVLIAILVASVIGMIHFGFQKILKLLQQTNQELTTNKDMLQSMLETSKDGIALLDLQTNFLYFNDAYMAMTGFSAEELMRKKCADITVLGDQARGMQAFEQVIRDGYLENFEKTCIVKDGKKIMINMSIVLMPDKERFLVTAKNVTEAKKLQRQVQDYVQLIDENVITSTTDLAGKIVYVSDAFCKISGYSREELLGRNHRIVRHVDMERDVYEDLWGTISQNKVWEGEIKNSKKDGSFYWVHARIYPIYDEDGIKTGYTAIRQDITDKKRIEEISRTDALTGIYNRRRFNELFPRIINSAKRRNETVCLGIIDVDHFKQYNDTYGHQKGDEVLIDVASVLRSCLSRADDYCFRLGGEEFGIVFKTDEMQTIFAFADRIRREIEAMRIEHTKNDVSAYVTISFGLIYAQGASAEDMDTLYREADRLLYKAKEAGRNRIEYAQYHDQSAVLK